jgi:HEAT repeat protein
MDYRQIAAHLLSDDPAIRLAALAALQQQDDHTPLPPDVSRGLLVCLGHTRKTIQRGAAEQLIRFSRVQPEIVTALTKKLADPDPRVRWTAAFTLSQLPLPEPLPLPVLLENLGHDESDLRWAAATAILRLATHHPRVITEVLRLARAGNTVQRRMALYCLRDLAHSDEEARIVYRASLSDPDPMVRLGGLSCLGKLKLATPEVREAVLRMVENDPDQGVRRAAAATLGHLADSAPAVIEALSNAARSDDVGLRKAALGALKRLQQE